jgi:hypothetical protein
MLWDRTCRLGQVRRRRATRGAGKYRAPGSRAPAAPVLAVTAFLDVAFRVSVPLAAWPNPNRGYCSSRGAVSRTRPRQRTRCFTLAGWITSDQRAVSPLNQLHTDNSTVDAHHLRGSFCFLFFWPKKVLQYLFALPNIQMTSHKFTRLS